MIICVMDLISKVNMVDLQKLFGTYGKVTSVSLTSDREAPFGTRHIAFIEMPVRDEGLSAIKALDGTKIEGIAISVKEQVSVGGVKITV